MGIGTSLGAFHADEFQHEASPWFIDPKQESSDNNTIDPDIDPGSTVPLDNPVIKAGYDTPLSQEEKTKYDSKFSKEDSTDYDMQGFYKANPDVEPHTDGAHYPDTYKKPNHPTFSDESIYHGVDGNEGGHWGSTSEGEDTFTPGPTNVKTHGLLGLIDYFNEVEPKAHLMMPRK